MTDEDQPKGDVRAARLHRLDQNGTPESSVLITFDKPAILRVRRDWSPGTTLDDGPGERPTASGAPGETFTWVLDHDSDQLDSLTHPAVAAATEVIQPAYETMLDTDNRSVITDQMRAELDDLVDRWAFTLWARSGHEWLVTTMPAVHLQTALAASGPGWHAPLPNRTAFRLVGDTRVNPAFPTLGAAGEAGERALLVAYGDYPPDVLR